MINNYFSWLMEAGNWIGFGTILSVLAGFVFLFVCLWHLDFRRWSKKKAARVWLSATSFAFSLPWVWIGVIPVCLMLILTWVFTPEDVEIEDIISWIYDHTIGVFER